jgi:hypothetical protein
LASPHASASAASASASAGGGGRSAARAWGAASTARSGSVTVFGALWVAVAARHAADFSGVNCCFWCLNGAEGKMFWAEIRCSGAAAASLLAKAYALCGLKVEG